MPCRRPAPSRTSAALVAFALAIPFAKAGVAAGDEYVDPIEPALAVYRDPGTGAWEGIDAEDVIAECGLDPDILADIDSVLPFPYAVVRYGKLCHEHYPPPTGELGSPAQLGELRENFSATKTLGATVVGRAARMSASLPMPLSDEDRMDAWIGDISFHPDALVADVLAMVGHNESLAFGERTFEYDADGSVQINRLSDVVEAVIAQDPEHFGGVATTGAFAQAHLFEPLGMQESVWEGEIFGTSWQSSLRDMARLGLLLVHEGAWDERQLIDRAWVRKITHPAYEDANTAYGYLTWVAAAANWYLPGSENPIVVPPGLCQPNALWPAYPHGLSESADCGYGGLASCEQEYDVGVFAAVGFGGQLIVGHRGLDLVLVAKDAGILAYLNTPWDLVKEALVAHDPVYAGDSAAFCADYAAGAYAPDLITLPEPAGGLGSSAVLSALFLLAARRRRASRGSQRRRPRVSPTHA